MATTFLGVTLTPIYFQQNPFIFADAYGKLFEDASQIPTSGDVWMYDSTKDNFTSCDIPTSYIAHCRLAEDQMYTDNYYYYSTDETTGTGGKQELCTKPIVQLNSEIYRNSSNGRTINYACKPFEHITGVPSGYIVSLPFPVSDIVSNNNKNYFLYKAVCRVKETPTSGGSETITETVRYIPMCCDSGPLPYQVSKSFLDVMSIVGTGKLPEACYWNDSSTYFFDSQSWLNSCTPIAKLQKIPTNY